MVGKPVDLQAAATTTVEKMRREVSKQSEQREQSRDKQQRHHKCLPNATSSAIGQACHLQRCVGEVVYWRIVSTIHWKKDASMSIIILEIDGNCIWGHMWRPQLKSYEIKRYRISKLVKACSTGTFLWGENVCKRKINANIARIDFFGLYHGSIQFWGHNVEQVFQS